MSQQSRSFQKKYLASRQDYKDLYWYPEAMLPPSRRKHLLSDGYTPISYPGAWIPVVPVGNDPDASLKIVNMLCDLFKPFIPYVMEVSSVLTTKNELEKTRSKWYIWTEDINIDVVCVRCGIIETLPHTLAEEFDEWLCTKCAKVFEDDEHKYFKKLWEELQCVSSA